MTLTPATSSTGSGGGLFDAYALLRDQRAANTAGGAATTGSFQTHTLQTETYDSAGIVTLASNQFTLAAGAYYIRATAVFFRTSQTKLKIRDITAGADALIGDSVFSMTNAGEGTVTALVEGRIAPSVTTAYELQYQVANNDSGNTNGLGIPANVGVVEIYAQVEIWREA